MRLDCACYDDEDAAWWYEISDYMNMDELPRRKRCKSCEEFINSGDTVMIAHRWRYPNSELEESIHGPGNEIRMGSWYYCEKCADILATLTDPVEKGGLGYCAISIDLPMADLLKKHLENVSLVEAEEAVEV